MVPLKNHRFLTAVVFVSLQGLALLLGGCGGGGSAASAPLSALPASASSEASVETSGQSVAVRRASASIQTNRPGFVGAFFRPLGAPPFGVFSPQSSQVAPVPYPVVGPTLTGPSGYCDQKAANGASIDGSFVVDPTKLTNLINAGARWSRMPMPQFTADVSHIFGSGRYAFGAIDAAQCISYVYHGIRPIIGLEAGPVQYNSQPGTFSPAEVPTYQSASDFAQWCGAVASHERSTFPGVTQFSLPGNEVNSNPQLFPGGESQIASYSKACYAAVKAANPSSYVYGFELNMDGGLNAPAFVARLVALGCGPGTCYDGLAIHLSLRYPIPAATTPCYPNAGGDYSMQCVTDVENASRAPIHVLISESGYMVPATVPNESVKGDAIAAELAAYAANSTVDGVSYANIDECALYTGYFSGGCLIDASGHQLPGYSALQWIASQHFL